MKIIALIGPLHSGKSTTMGIVYEEIKKAGAVVKCGKPHDFMYSLQHNGKNIAFYTKGEHISTIINAINWSYSEKYDIFVCAICSNIFEYDIVKEEIFNYTPSIVYKNINAEYSNYMNLEDANVILTKIIRHCNQKGDLKKIRFGMKKNEIKEILSKNLDLGNILHPISGFQKCYETIDVEGVPFNVSRYLNGLFSVTLWRPIPNVNFELHKEIIHMGRLLEVSLNSLSKSDP